MLPSPSGNLCGRCLRWLWGWSCFMKYPGWRSHGQWGYDCALGNSKEFGWRECLRITCLREKMIDTQHLTVAFYSKESGPKGRSDFRLKNADFRFKSSGPRGKECMHLNLQSPICNHKSYTDWHQGPGFLCRIKKEAIITDRLLSSILVELIGIEPTTSWMPFKRSPNWATAPAAVNSHYI